MRKAVAVAVVALFAFIVDSYAGTAIKPATTLAAETSNNTSAADTFQAQANGNLGASNISKVDTRTLLYPGSTGRIYTHFMPWFGQSSHMDVGYSSNDPSQIRRQVDDMLSRGITGAIIDWYGPNKTWNNTTAILVQQEAEVRNGQFTFAITEDQGALKACASTAGCDVTQQLISDLTYAYNTFEVSPAYMRIDGQPLVFFFDVDNFSINWSTVAASVPGTPLFIFRNSGGFTHSYSSGSYAWVILTSDPNDWSQSYLDNFYATALKYPAGHSFAAPYKGFNDTLAAWGSNRVMNQNCGQTWLSSFAEPGNYFSSANQLESVQIVTWNDYEEGSEIESGIDNCVIVSGSTAGNTLNWNITGQENTVDHYTVFISLDGINLMPLTDVPAGTYTLDLSPYAFGPGNYTIYVKAIGKPSLKNQMSPAISFSVADQPPTASLSVTPTSGIAPLAVTASTSGSSDVDGTITAASIDFGDGIIVSAATASHTYSTPGTYTVQATVTDNGGLTSSSSATVTVQAPIPYVVSVASPLNGSTVSSPVHFVAAATSPFPVTGMKVYVDSVSVYTTTAASFDTYVSLAPGTHAVTVKAWNTTGAIASQKLNITVADKPPVVALSVTPTSGTAPVTVIGLGRRQRPGRHDRLHLYRFWRRNRGQRKQLGAHLFSGRDVHSARHGDR